MATTRDRLPAADASGAAGNGHSDHGAAEHARSPWVGIDPQVDPVRWARLLRRAHELALSQGRPPSILRDVVARSWTRAAQAGVDPDGPAPKMLDAPETAHALAQHPVSHLLPLIESMLSEATEDARYFAVLSDAEGVLLWAGGHPEALQIAVAPGFLPGHLCSESAVGTNAVGTALELDHPVQIFSAEHFNRRLHGWTCSAAPIHDPETHDILGVLDLSGSFRTGHPHSLSLVAAVARVMEDRLAAEQARRDERLKTLYLERIARGVRERSALVTRAGRVLAASPRGWLGSRIRVPKGERLTLPTGEQVFAEPVRGAADAILLRAGRRGARHAKPKLALHALGGGRALLELDGESIELSPRHSDIVALLVAHPEGLTSRELARGLYGPGGKQVTVRAEMSRLRRVLGPVLARDPYRLDADVSAGRAVAEQVLGKNRLR
jgi:hypothetical protein